MTDENINPNAEGGHTEMYGICENKCFVPVSPKTDTDAVKNRVTALETKIPGTITISASDPTGGTNGDIWLKYT